MNSKHDVLTTQSRIYRIQNYHYDKNKYDIDSVNSPRPNNLT